MKTNLLNNRVVRNVLSALAVTGVGFALLNVVFVADFFYQTAVRTLLKLFTPIDFNMMFWYPPLMHASFVILIGLLSWFVFRSKLGVLFKATCMTVPLAAVYLTIGMFFFRWPIAVYSLSFIFGLSVLYYLYRTKQPWLYYYSLILISLTMLIVGLTGTEI